VENRISKRNFWIACLCVVLILGCFALWDVSQYFKQQKEVIQEDDGGPIIEINHEVSVIEATKDNHF